jgi:hypothetical protein
MATEQIRAADLNTCFITLKYGDRLILVVLLAREGSINRMGDATSKADDTWYIGKVQEPLFDQLLEVVPDDLFQYAGRLEIPDRRGIDCELAVVFLHKDGRAVPFEILFGSETQDVPTELLDIVSRAMELTDPWWKKQPGQAVAVREERPAGGFLERLRRSRRDRPAGE